MYCRAYGTPSTKLPPLTGLTTNRQELFRKLKAVSKHIPKDVNLAGMEVKTRSPVGTAFW